MIGPMLVLSEAEGLRSATIRLVVLGIGKRSTTTLSQGGVSMLFERSCTLSIPASDRLGAGMLEAGLLFWRIILVAALLNSFCMIEAG